MRTDYKFWFIKRDDNGYIIEVAVRYYEGEVTAELEKDRSGIDMLVTRYRRTRRLQKSDLTHLFDKKFVKDASEKDTVIYYPSDFGQIKTDDELRSFLNKELKKDTQRAAIDEQT